MAGITDLPFRNLVASFGAGLVVSEMVASQEMVQARPSARKRADLGLGNDASAVQIAGRDPYWMAECARLCADQGARIIDINMGCPAKKVTSGLSGSALMKEPDLALSLIEAVVGAVDVPVTLKTRLGWDDDCLNAASLAARAVNAGVRMVTIHGRTRCQFYKGRANWSAITEVVGAVDVPVIANGDIVSVHTARQARRQSGAAGLMVGRGAQGQPWLLQQIAAAEGHGAPIVPPEGRALADLIAGHYEAMLAFYGADLGLRVARKHLGWYLDRLSGAAPLKSAVFRAQDPQTVLRLLRDIANLAPTEARAA